MIQSLAKAWEAATLTQIAVWGYIVIGFVVVFAISARGPSWRQRLRDNFSTDKPNSGRDILWMLNSALIFASTCAPVAIILEIALWPALFVWYWATDDDET